VFIRPRFAALAFSLERWLAQVKQLARVLTAPHASITDAQERRRVRFLVAFALSTSAINFILIIPLTLLAFFAEGVLIMALTGLVGVGVYFISRTRTYKAAYPASIGLAMLFTCIMVMEYPEAHTAVLAMLPIFMSSLFYGSRGILITTLIGLILIIGASFVFPGNWVSLPLTLAYIVGSTAITVMSNWLLRQSEFNLHTRSNQLQESQSRFRAAMDGSLHSFYILKSDHVNADWTILEANRMAEQCSSIPRIASTMRILQASMLPNGCGEVILKRCKDALQTQQTISDTLTTANDTAYEYVIVPFNDCVALTINDITERKRTEKQALDLALERERVVLLQQIIGDASHDMMSPLSVVRTNVYLLKQAADAETRAPRLAAVEQQITRLQFMIRDLVTMSELDHLSSSKLTITRMDANVLVNEIGSVYEAVAENKQHKLVLQNADMPLYVVIDRPRIETAITNLIENAIKYTPAGSTITLSVAPAENGINIDVRDNGKGLSDQDLPHLFERYYRADEHRDAASIPGSGLGLTIVKKLVETHHGRVEAHNLSEGGALFRIWLPSPLDLHSGKLPLGAGSTEVQ
jgi:signal transduction histidine kinase